MTSKRDQLEIVLTELLKLYHHDDVTPREYQKISDAIDLIIDVVSPDLMDEDEEDELDFFENDWDYEDFYEDEEDEEITDDAWDFDWDTMEVLD
jgi:hypothetical protein